MVILFININGYFLFPTRAFHIVNDKEYYYFDKLFHSLPRNFAGLKVADQLVVHATRCLIVRLKNHV